MVQYSILIVEDNLPFAIKLEKVLMDWGHNVIGIESNSEKALKLIKKERPDMILMDIFIEGELNGIDIVNKMQGLDPHIIFMTAEKDEATYKEAIKSKALNFLVKPFSMLTLKAAIDLAANRTAALVPSKQDDYPNIFIKKNGELIQVNTGDIDWVQSDLNYCDLHFKDKRFTIRTSLAKFMNEQLPEDKFVQVHKRFVVRIGAIEKIVLAEKFLIVNSKKIPLGKNYRKQFLEKIS